ncbi:MAG: type III pantothenate kinase [Phycisphaerales bacterium]
MASEFDLVAVSVGNTRTRLGVFRGAVLEESEAVANAEPGALAGAASAMLAKAGEGTPVLVASVNDPVADGLVAALRGSGAASEVHRFGRELEVPITTALRAGAEKTVGQDRLLNALGAYARANQACVVIDAGTAITVDFVDGEGTFQGGAIAPGLNTMLAALHEHTAALPSLRFESPRELATGAEPFGKDTREAMLIGVRAAARGCARELVERYAEFFGAYPQVVATGGDARTLFEGDDVVEHIVPDLTLLGMQAAWAIAAGAGE